MKQHEDTAYNRPNSNDEITVVPSAILEAVNDELLDYFSEPAVTGVRLHQTDASWIAVGVLRRVLSSKYRKRGIKREIS